MVTSDADSYEKCEHCQVGDSYATYDYFGVEAWLCEACAPTMEDDGEFDV